MRPVVAWSAKVRVEGASLHVPEHMVTHWACMVTRHSVKGWKPLAEVSVPTLELDWPTPVGWRLQKVRVRQQESPCPDSIFPVFLSFCFVLKF